MRQVRDVLKALQDLPPSDRLLSVTLITSDLAQLPPLDLRLPRMGISGTAVVTPPYPADLVQTPQQDAVKSSQIRTLVIVLIWLMAIIVPIVQQRLSTEGQLVTDAEVGTLSFALAITTLMKQGRK
jgi:hypothetical protein